MVLDFHTVLRGFIGFDYPALMITYAARMESVVHLVAGVLHDVLPPTVGCRRSGLLNGSISLRSNVSRAPRSRASTASLSKPRSAKRCYFPFSLTSTHNKNALLHHAHVVFTSADSFSNQFAPRYHAKMTLQLPHLLILLTVCWYFRSIRIASPSEFHAIFLKCSKRN